MMSEELYIEIRILLDPDYNNNEIEQIYNLIYNQEQYEKRSNK